MFAVQEIREAEKQKAPGTNALLEKRIEQVSANLLEFLSN
jgi:hypothetical protein